MAEAKSFTLATPADQGFRNASSYDQHRPSYPPSAVSSFLSHLGVAGRANSRIVEIGAGTGKFTELLAKREEGYEIVAVEPHDGMRKSLAGKNLESSGTVKVKVVDGDAGRTGIEDAWGDACIAAQAFHWFATKETLQEIHRVLRPEASFGVIWNIEDYNSPRSWPCATEWEQKMNDVIWSFDDAVPRFRHQKWKDAFEAQLDSTPLQTLVDTFKQDFPQFSLPLGEEKVEWTVWLTEDAIWERFLTLSQIAILEGADRDRIKNKVFEAMKGEDVERNIKGELALHGATYFAWTSRV